MTFEIGDAVIMTADSGKGVIQHSFQNGNYRGVISSIDENDLSIEATLLNGYKFWFDANGICMGLPGMSIRLAKEEPTPSQWIEGAPKQPGHYWCITGDDNIIHPIFYCFPKDHDIRRHCPISELPPPPPAKEVEAYGMLEAILKIQNEFHDNNGWVAKITPLKNFYSQPATAEVLNKYLKPKDINDRWICDYPRLTLDQFISWCVVDKDIPLFTPAAFDMLGVK